MLAHFWKVCLCLELCSVKDTGIDLRWCTDSQAVPLIQNVQDWEIDRACLFIRYPEVVEPIVDDPLDISTLLVDLWLLDHVHVSHDLQSHRCQLYLPKHITSSHPALCHLILTHLTRSEEDLHSQAATMGLWRQGMHRMNPTHNNNFKLPALALRGIAGHDLACTSAIQTRTN